MENFVISKVWVEQQSSFLKKKSIPIHNLLGKGNKNKILLTRQTVNLGNFLLSKSKY